MDDENVWHRPEPVAAPPRPRQNGLLGLITILTAIGTMVFELRFFGMGLEAQHELPWLPVVLAATIVLCVVAGFWRARVYGVIGGFLILLPGLLLAGTMMMAGIANSS